jgi:polyhydroxyalkanoate synthesis repressor PhaR
MVSSPQVAADIEKHPTADELIKIKKYANRRLYNTATSSYVTLDHLCQMVKEGKDFVVHDAKTNEDITRSVLTQIIFEEESKGQSLLPISFLRQIISFYGDSLQALVPSYLEASMSTFHKNQEQMRQYVQNTFGEMFPFRQFEDMGRQNMAMFQRAMSMFNPFAAAMEGKDKPKAVPASGGGEDISSLRDKLEALEKQIDSLSKK